MNNQIPCTPCKNRRFKSRRKKRFFAQEEEQQRRNVTQIIQLKTSRKATSYVEFPEENVFQVDNDLENKEKSSSKELGLPAISNSVDFKTDIASPDNIKPPVIDSPLSLEKKPPEFRNFCQDEATINTTTTPVANNDENKELITLARRLSFLSPFRNVQPESEKNEGKQVAENGIPLNQSYGFSVLEDMRMKSFASSFDASMSSFLDASIDSSMRQFQVFPCIYNPFLCLVDKEACNESWNALDDHGFQKQRSSSLVNEEVKQFLPTRTIANEQLSGLEGNPRGVENFLQLSRYTRDFEELGVLGSGSFGKVYKCRSRMDGCLYAIKSICRKNSSPCERNRAIKEVHAMAAFNKCPRFVRYYSSWEEDNILFIQMEYCQQGSVMSLWENQKRIFETSDLAKFLHQVLQGLCYLHDRQVVHLDVKPENIYLTNDGVYKIGDFGLVTPIPREGEQGCSNIDKDIFEGDSRYLPLELLQEDYKDLKKADIFSLGLSAYELARPVNRPLPRAGEEWHKIRSSELEPVTTISPELLELLQWMTRKEPKQRPTARTAIVYLENIAPKELYE